MKKYLLIITLLNVFTFVKAQSVTISDDINIRSDNGYEILGRYKGNVLLFRDKAGESEIVAFDEQMRNRWQKTIDYEERRAQVLDAIGGKDYFSIVYRGRLKGGTVVKICRFDGAANFIDSMTAVNYGNRLAMPNPRCIYSENKKTVLIYSFDEREKIEATVIDLDNMKVLWSKTSSLKEMNAKAEEEHILISNDGKVYFIFEKEATGTLFSSEAQQFVVYEINGAEIKMNVFGVGDKIIYNAQFAYDNQHHRLNGVAMASEKSKSKPTGTLWIENAGATNVNQYFTNFSDETMAAITGKKATTNKGIGDLKMQELAFRKDGGVIAIAEEVRQFTRAINSMNRGYTVNDVNAGRITFDYYHESLIAISFNPDGTRHWEKVMHKKQFSQDDDGVYASYGLMKTPAALRLIFNDEIKNETTTSEYLLTGGGNVDRHSLFNTAQQDIIMRFRDALQIGSEEVIIPSEYRSHLRLVRVKY